jgi:hypothetical protein
MKLEVGHLQVTELIDMVQAGRLALPEFQRDFVWRPDAVCDLLCSVARKWPIGSFLVMASKDRPFQLRPLEQAPPLAEETDYIVLDGQQRCTSFYHAFTDNSPDVVYYLQFPEDWGSFDDEQIRFEKKPKFVKKYPTLESMAADRVIRICDVHDDVRFEKWKSYLVSDDERTKAVNFRSREIGGLKDISIPNSKLSGTPDLRAVAKIFETINRTGKRLDTFDLLVARLYPFDFKLRDKWDDARATYPELVHFEVDGLEVLKLIALRRWSKETSAGLTPTVKGVKQSDVLMLEADTVKMDWDVAVEAYVDALRFLRTEGGVTCPGLLPQPSLPLTIGFFMAPDQGQRHGFTKDLRRWYWATCFKQTYAQGANTQVLRDVKSLRAWDAADTAVPDVLAQFSVSEEHLKEGRRLNEMVVRAILGRQIVNGARDWSDGALMNSLSEAEIHHVFPQDVLATLAGGSKIVKDPILNFAAIKPSTNGKIRNEVPATVLGRTDIQPNSVKTHGVDPTWVVSLPGEALASTVARFLDHRLPYVKDLMQTAVDGQ